MKIKVQVFAENFIAVKIRNYSKLTVDFAARIEEKTKDWGFVSLSY